MKVAAMYRVSTDKQVKKDGDDSIPVQRNAVRAFIAGQAGWALVREYSEEGVSGFKVSADDRDVLQQVLKDAKAGQWQILVVFKADRLSRNSFEYPLVLDRLRRLGCDVWSVADAPGGKQLALDTQMDKFIRFLEGWQAETESKNTSIRVSEAMLQMAREGRWTGGRVPYGYRLAEGRRKGSAAPALTLDPEKAETIRLMVSLYLEERLGAKQIASELNRRGIPNPSGHLWTAQTVRRILQNPIIAGLPAYNRTRAGPNGQPVWKNPYDLSQFVLPRDENGHLRPIEHFQIIPLEVWLKLMKAMEASKTPPRAAAPPVPGSPAVRYAVTERYRSAHGILTGVVFCGHCGARLSSDVTNQKVPRKDGSVTICKVMYYICRTHLRVGKEFCGGQRTYGRARLERAVGDQLRQLLTMLDPAELKERILSGVHRHEENRQVRLENLEAELGKAGRILAGWLERMDQFLAGPGDSPYSEEILTEKIRAARTKADGLRQEIHSLRSVEKSLAEALGRIEEFTQLAPHWWSCFEQSDPVQQKLMLRDIVERVIVTRSEVEILFKVGLEAFLPGTGEPGATVAGRTPDRAVNRQISLSAMGRFRTKSDDWDCRHAGQKRASPQEPAFGPQNLLL